MIYIKNIKERFTGIIESKNKDISFLKEQFQSLSNKEKNHLNSERDKIKKETELQISIKENEIKYLKENINKLENQKKTFALFSN